MTRPVNGRPLHERLSEAQRIIGHGFSDPGLLELALTHPSFSDEPHATHDYERLEFLGDAVLGLVIVEAIYARFPEMPEGGMTKLKVSLVAGTTLAATARELGLAELLLLGDSEIGTGGRGMASALENVFEATCGALYLDGGLAAARAFILGVLGDRIEEKTIESLEHPKSRLQEITQSRGSAPEYHIVAEEGPPHERSFVATVLVDGRPLGSGTGHSKKEAEMNAAREALGQLESS
ncbi:MAG: ribonuclease III [Coriobacteriia bacterium]|nr:ribonuclease III [Coriobacteriia bacterium]